MRNETSALLKDRVGSLPWHEVISAREDGKVITAYCFGPCLMLVQRSKGSIQVNKEFLLNGKSFHHENDLIKYLDRNVMK